MFLKKVLLLLITILLPCLITAQELGFGDWRDHLPYNRCTGLAMVDNAVFVATPYGLFSLDKSDNSFTRFNKATGLSDVSVTAIEYSTEFKTLVIGYANANLDLLKDGKVVNMPDIKRKSVPGNKTINRIFIKGKYAYLSCGFGIVVIDIDREEVHDTYLIGPGGSQINVSDLTFDTDNNLFYAATESGILAANASTNLAYFMNWTGQQGGVEGKNFNHIQYFAGKVYANSTPRTSSFSKDTLYVLESGNWTIFQPGNTSNRYNLRVSNNRLIVANYLSVETFKPDGSQDVLYWTYNPGFIRPNDACYDADKVLWIADNDNGLYSMGNDFKGNQYLINGPASSLVASLSVSGKTLWAVPGGRDFSFIGVYNHAQIYTYNGSWTSYNRSNMSWMENMRDVLCVAADPNDPNHAFMGTWGYGLIEFNDGQLVKVHTPENSSLQPSINSSTLTFVGGVAYDDNHNLWVTNSTAPNILSVYKNSGEWKSYNLGSYGTAVDVGGLAVDHYGQKWMQLRDLALLVFNDNNTPDNSADDQVKKLTNVAGNGALLGNRIASMAVDKNGQLWLGTDMGVLVIYSPENVFNGGNYDAQRVMVPEGAYLYPLLETEVVTAIAVNGNNQKWFGTEKSGVYLMSPDGTKQVYHFTEENSPLLSNSITSIGITSDGEVIFGTANGIISYRDYSISPPTTLDSVYIYPNPVREGYNGPIAITNVVADSFIKITDVSGNRVWETQAEGGRVIWNGNDLKGRRVNTGVYLVFITNPDGTQKKVTKIMVIK